MEIWPRSAQRPSATQAVATRNRFTRCRIIARVPSATALVPAPGVTTTAMPRRVASSTSTRSTPTPVRATTFSSGVRSSRSVSTSASARTIAPVARCRSSAVGLATNVALAGR